MGLSLVFLRPLREVGNLAYPVRRDPPEDGPVVNVHEHGDGTTVVDLDAGELAALLDYRAEDDRLTWLERSRAKAGADRVREILGMDGVELTLAAGRLALDGRGPLAENGEEQPWWADD